MALDVVPVGAALIDNTDELPEYLGAEAQDITSVGSIIEPSLEQIAELDPDLILGAKSRHEDLYETFSDIAPTVFEDPGGDWRNSVHTVGEALGVPDAADALLSDYDERTAEVKEDLGLEGLSAQVIRPREAGAIRLYGPDTFTGDVLTDLGFEIPEQDWEDNGTLEVSSENAGDVAGDWVFMSSDPTTPDLPDWTLELLEGTDSEIHEVDHEAGLQASALWGHRRSSRRSKRPSAVREQATQRFVRAAVLRHEAQYRCFAHLMKRMLNG